MGRQMDKKCFIWNLRPATATLLAFPEVVVAILFHTLRFLDSKAQNLACEAQIAVPVAQNLSSELHNPKGPVYCEPKLFTFGL